MPHSQLISIHAPARGATTRPSSVLFISCIFQSTLLREERPLFFCSLLIFLFISIHAPARGATEIFCGGEIRSEFQSTLLREERRQRSPLPIATYCISIHAPARGATGKALTCPHGLFYFNPRSCERSDLQRQNRRFRFIISIHAPARGATAKITYFSQNKDLCLGNTNNTQHYPNVQAKFKYEMLPIYLLSLVRTSL